MLLPRFAIFSVALIALIPFFAAPSRAEDQADGKVDFATQIRPLLSDRCFLCHGPAAESRATDLRLDESDSAYDLAIEPGDIEASELIARITSDDPDEQMPPPESNLSMSPAEIDLLTRWVREGAEYEGHWAFQTPIRPDVPSPELSDWPRTPIDAFVLQRLEEENLAPRTPAPPETQLRRLAIDLTGLPPTLEELDAFTADHSDAAYEHWVDTYLSRSSFGEKWAIDWLDVARYADTYGYQNDRYRAMWPWRDWVVSALNDNLPYDQFITWQLAGDLLPDATQEQILATAFNRNHRQTNEGGSVEEEFRAEYVADRVNTFGAAFLGLTLECCRCHDHKYDPVSQADYYSLSAFFNSIDESGLYSHFNDSVPTPTLRLDDEKLRASEAALEQKIASTERQLDEQRASTSRADFEQWLHTLTDVRPRKQPAQAETTGANEVTEPSASLVAELDTASSDGLVAHLSFERLDGNKLPNEVTDAAEAKLTDAPKQTTGQLGQALALDGEDGFTLKPGGEITRNDPFSIQFWIRSPEQFERAVVLHRSRAWTDSGSRGFELLIEEGKLSFALIHFWPGNAARIRAHDIVPTNQWKHITLTYDGSSRADGMGIYVDGRPVDVEVVRDSLSNQITGVTKELAFGNRFRDVGFKGGAVDEVRVYKRRLAALEIRYHYLREALPENVAEWIHNLPDDQLRNYFAQKQTDAKALVNKLHELRSQRSKLVDPVPLVMVMKELPQPRQAHVLIRGAYDSIGPPVQRNVPQAVFQADFPTNPTRLDLAKWLTDPKHPLTSRVAVNRIWQSLFGTGLVATSEDFGLQGSAPTHSELLDWLATDFVDSGWDTKRLIKQMVMSATYRQSSDPTKKLLTFDPENRLLARGPAVRLSAEALRDSALSSAGILVDRVGGPAVKPYQPAGLWKEKSGKVYSRDKGEGSRRKSLYTYWKRTSPPPSMMTFDASNREVCVVRRQPTMTPMQTLVLLNDPQYVEAARALADRVMKTSDDSREQLTTMFRLLTSRQPNSDEVAALQQIYAGQRDYFARLPDERDAFLKIGDYRSPVQSADSKEAPTADSVADNDANSQVTTPADPTIEQQLNQLAGLAAVAGGMMSHDEFVMKR